MAISVVNTKDKKLIVYVNGSIYKMPIKKAREYVQLLLEPVSDRSCVLHGLELLQFGAKQEDIFKWK